MHLHLLYLNILCCDSVKTVLKSLCEQEENIKKISLIDWQIWVSMLSQI